MSTIAGEHQEVKGILKLKCRTHLIICGTVTLEFSSKTFIMRPLQRMLSTH